MNLFFLVFLEFFRYLTITETIQRLESIKASLIFARQRAEELVISEDE